MKNNFWKNKKVIIVGHTGFKGSWLSIWLKELGADILGISLKPKNPRDNFCVSGLHSKIKTAYQDIRNFEKIDGLFKKFGPEIIFHLAAQALVGKAYENPKGTFETNAMGTLNVLEAIRNCKTVRSAVLITSDKCYQNVEQILGYKEGDRLGGEDPYSASKGCAEMIIHSYLKCYFNNGTPLIASGRAGNVIGGGDWSENRIVPDCFRSLFSKRPILIRNPHATRPWQFVLEPLRGYMTLAKNLYRGQKKLSGCWNFGPPLEQVHTVRDVTDSLIKNWGSGEIKVEKKRSFHESNLLQLDCTKARQELGWQTVLTLPESIRLTTEWYKRLHGNTRRNMYDFCVQQIKKYERICSHEN